MFQWFFDFYDAIQDWRIERQRQSLERCKAKSEISIYNSKTKEIRHTAEAEALRDEIQAKKAHHRLKMG